MSRQRKKNIHQQPESQKQKNVKVKDMPFGILLKRLFNTIIWRIKPKKYLHKKCNYRGKYRKIIGETFDFFILEGFPKDLFPKVGNKFKIK